MVKAPITILYIDSRSEDRRLVKDLLVRSNDAFQISEVTSRIELNDQIKTGSYDLILSELAFPGFEDLEILDFLHKEHPEVPVIIVSDCQEGELKARAIKRGAAYYINKSSLENLPLTILDTLKQNKPHLDPPSGAHLSRLTHKKDDSPTSSTISLPSDWSDDLTHEVNIYRAVVGHWEWIIATHQLYWSPEMYAIFGVKQLITAEQYERMIYPEDNQGFHEGLLVHLFNHPTGIRGYRIVRPDGEVRHVHDESRLVMDASGQPWKIVGTTQDISYQKQIEKALHESEALFRSTFENAGYGMVVLTPDGTIDRANQAYETILGYSDGDLPGSQVLNLLHPDDRAVNFELAQQIAGGHRQRYQVVNRYLHRSGAIIFCRTTVTPVRDEHDRITYFVCMLHDITETKNMEQALMESENRLRLLFERSANAMFQFDGHHFLDCNDAALTLLKCQSKDEIINRSPIDFSPEYQPDGQPSSVKGKQIIKQALREGTVYFEWMHQKSDGESFYVEVSITALPLRHKKEFFATWHDITQRRGTEERIQHQLQRLAALHSIDMSISNSTDLHNTLELVLKITLDELHVDAGAILLIDQKTNHLNYAASRGFNNTENISCTSLERGKGYPWQALLNGRLVVINDLCNAPNSLPFLASENFVAYYCVPLVAKGEMRGVMELFNRTAIKPDQEWLDFMKNLAGRATIALDNGFLLSNFKRVNEDLVDAYDITIEGWARALEMRDLETEGHSRRVTNLTINLATKMGIDANHMEHIRRGALLHDIGKMGIPDNVLFKPGPLDDTEWEVMRRHPTYAFKMLCNINFLSPALDIPYFHQERWNGSGYPCGLKGEDIPLPARIFAVVDVWDALTSTRPYRPKWSVEQTAAYLKENAGTLFDPTVVDTFLSIVT